MNLRESNGRYKESKRIYYMMIFMLGALTGLWLYTSVPVEYVTAEPTRDVDAEVEAKYQEKVEELKAEVRNKIIHGESDGYVIEDGEVFFTFDPYSKIAEKCSRVGGKMDLDCLSFGQLQFKVSTIIYYEKKLNDRDVTEQEAIAIAHDTDEASRLFDDIVYGEEGGVWNWSAAEADKAYYSTVIPIIRSLQE